MLSILVTFFRRNLGLVLAVAAALIAIATKLALTSGALLPGLDGAFYWVQVRSLLGGKGMAFDDLPLVFYGQTALAALVGDIPTAVRISDAVFPAFSAIPLYLMTRGARSPFTPAIAILAVLLFPVQLFFFTGDFIKNAAAIPFVFFIAWLLSNRENHSIRFTSIWLAVAYVALALSHFGTLLMGLLVGFLWLVLQLRNRSPKFWVAASGVSIGAGALVLALLWWLVPARFERLIGFATSADVVFKNPAFLALIQGRAWPVMMFTIVFCQVASILGGWLTYRNRKSLTYNDLSLAIASLVTAFSLSSPALGSDWSDRLAALAFAPLAVSFILIFRVTQIKWHKAAILAAVTLAVVSSLFLVEMAKRPVLSDSVYASFKSLVSEIALPANSVVVASHGIEYLTAWEMKTDVLEETFYPDTDLSTYGSVYYMARKYPGGASQGVTGQVVAENSDFSLRKIR